MLLLVHMAGQMGWPDITLAGKGLGVGLVGGGHSPAMWVGFSCNSMSLVFGCFVTFFL
jgi:hypothetical protein